MYRLGEYNFPATCIYGPLKDLFVKAFLNINSG